MSDILKINRKCRPSLGACGVKPLTREMHEYLVTSYLIWPLIMTFGFITTAPLKCAAVVAAFVVMGFLFYNLLVAMVQMSHHQKKRLRTSQWIFCITALILALKIGWVLS
jgi:hypothetical protein